MDYNSAYTRTTQLKKFYRSLLFFAVVAVLIIPNDFFERNIFEDHIIKIRLFDGYTILAIWALILTIKAVKLFLFDSEWEKDMIERELKKDKQPIDF
ncbi:2TM domain-containing protein [Chryseobacterium sp.]|uniref:2TM domain-containing protein n=1 Tax=Chryseobacterium sp. TaxID=1871047 RepID=UPI0025BCE6C8|nr:2TM domain-containing protein [Chryseobacterium sp.]MBV8327063.1 2TM domain-containing protein [Chryseobacterium sp.]